MISIASGVRTSKSGILRVMKRVAGSAGAPSGIDVPLYDSLRWVFVRVAVACVVLIVAIGAFNAIDFDVSTAATWVDALLGLPSDALADALTYNEI